VDTEHSHYDDEHPKFALEISRLRHYSGMHGRSGSQPKAQMELLPGAGDVDAESPRVARPFNLNRTGPERTAFAEDLFAGRRRRQRPERAAQSPPGARAESVGGLGDCVLAMRDSPGSAIARIRRFGTL